MGSYRQRFLNKLAAVGALLRREARAYSDNLATSTCSLAAQDVQKRAPPSIQNALCQSTAGQPLYIEVFDHDCLVRIGVLLGDLEVEVAALAEDFEMRLRHTLRLLAAAMAALSASVQASLLAAQGRLTGSKEPWVLDDTSIAIGQKHLQAHIDPDLGPIISSRIMHS